MGLINRRQKTSSDNQQQQANAESTDESLSALATVKGDDWDETVHFYGCWQQSYQERQLILNSDISTEGYLKLFPYISQVVNGYELVIHY